MPHFVPYVTIATTKVYIKIVIYKSGNKLTDNDFN